ncbi:MAG: HAD family hydrolase [Gemmatimonadota bacterium]
MFRSKFWISLLLTIPTVVWGHMLMRLTGWMPPAFPGSQWIAPVFGTVVFFYGGLVFLLGTLRELKDRLPIPLVVAISTTLGARGGLLVRDRRGLEDARNLTAVVFDKTGTLTLGEHRVVEMSTAEAVSPDEALRLAAAVEQDSEHPVARAIVLSAQERGLHVPAVSDFESIPGRGVKATVEGRQLQGGGPNLLASLGVRPGPDSRRLQRRPQARDRGPSTWSSTTGCSRPSRGRRDPARVAGGRAPAARERGRGRHAHR